MPHHIINKNSWCPKCSRWSIDELHELANARGGKCLSFQINSIKDKLLWQCASNHQWTASSSNIINGTWCPECKISISELICKAYFEHIFDNKFIKIRPNWLINSKTGKKLELDGYCEELGIAFEHNGTQHYKKVKIFKTDLKYTIFLDNIKKQLCIDNGVKLFIIQELFIKTKIKDLAKIITDQCKDLAIDFPKKLPDVDLSFINNVIKNYSQNENLIGYNNYMDDL